MRIKYPLALSLGIMFTIFGSLSMASTSSTILNLWSAMTLVGFCLIAFSVENKK